MEAEYNTEVAKYGKQLEAIPALMSKMSKEYAIAEAEFKTLDEQKKAQLAQIEVFYQEKGEPQAETTRRALASVEWNEYLNGLSEARKKYLQAKANYNALIVKYEVLRSLLSHEKAKMKIL